MSTGIPVENDLMHFISSRDLFNSLPTCSSRANRSNHADFNVTRYEFESRNAFGISSVPSYVNLAATGNKSNSILNETPQLLLSSTLLRFTISNSDVRSLRRSIG